MPPPTPRAIWPARPGNRHRRLIAAPGLLLVRRPVTAVARLDGPPPPAPAEPGPASALLQLLLAVGQLGPQLPERGLLPHQRLRHLVNQARRVPLDVLLDPGLGLRISRSRVRGGLGEVLEQVVDGLLILSVHADADTRHMRANTRSPLPGTCPAEHYGGLCIDRGETRMPQPPHTQSLSKNQVLDELASLVTVEHALIVEYLTVCCALGHDLATTDNGPVNDASREAARRANALAAEAMLHVAALVRALSSVRPAGGLGRAREITDATGTTISLDPPGGDLTHLLERQQAIAAAVDARYARLIPAMAVSAAGEDAFSDDLRAAAHAGTNHADQLTELLDDLAGQSVADLLRATERFGSKDTDKVLLRMCDRTYGLVLGALDNFYGGLADDSAGTFRLLALNGMDVMNDVLRTLVHAKLLPRFPLPPP